MKCSGKSVLVSCLGAAAIVGLVACDPGAYGNNGWSNPQNNYPSYPNYPNTYPNNYPNSYPSNGYGGGYYPPPPPNYGYGYPPPRRYDQYDDRDRYHDHHDHHNHDDRNDDDRPPPQPRPNPTSSAPLPAATVRPSCPSGTSFDGRHCIINDKSKIRPGGKGTVNACPKGMRLSGDSCIPS